MANILVTGCAGFIGSHLCAKLVNNKHNVVGLDNLSNGKLSNLESIIKDNQFNFLKGDINDKSLLKRTLTNIDYVFHLAALADIVPSIKNPTDYFNSNVNGTFNLLNVCKDFKIKKFIYTASSSCYGIPQRYPTNEQSKIDLQYPYALTKNLGEQISFHFGKLYNIPVVSLRLFNVFGPRARTSGTYGAVFGVFLAQKLAGEPYTIVGNGEQTRDFTYVDDVVEAFIEMLHSDLSQEIFNVGSGDTYSINYLVKLLGGKFINIPKRPGEPDCTFADIGKITELTKWRPKISFEVGVKKILNHINDFKQAPLWNEKTIAEETKDWFKYLKNN
jgi:UDP-glucose 4-epimerase